MDGTFSASPHDKSLIYSQGLARLLTWKGSGARFRDVDLRTYLKKTKTAQADLARAIGVTPGLVWQWLHGHRRVGAERVLGLEAATGGAVTRHEIRPDLYPRDHAA